MNNETGWCLAEFMYGVAITDCWRDVVRLLTPVMSRIVSIVKLSLCTF